MYKILASSVAATLLLMGSVALAQTDTSLEVEATPPPVVFPIEELGGCSSKEACRVYCEDASHRDACYAFAEVRGLMTKAKIEAARAILSRQGPGGCNSAASCRAYCADSAHQEECMQFAEEKKILPPAKALLIRKLHSGEGPGACKSAETCRMYCADAAHQDECRAFANEHALKRPTPAEVRVKLDVNDERRLMEEKARMGSSTRPLPPKDEMLRKNASGTPSTVKPPAVRTNTDAKGEVRLNTEPKKPIPPKEPPKTETPTTNSDDLGAAVLRGFVKLLGF